MRISDWSSDVCSSDLAKIKDSVHHARHGHTRAGTDGYKQRVGSIAETLASDTLDMSDAVLHFLIQALGIGLALFIIASAHFGRDRETRRHGQTDGSHSVQVRAFAAQQVLVAVAAVGNAATEPVHIFGDRKSTRLN